MGKIKLWTGRYHYTTESRFVSSPPGKHPGSRGKPKVRVSDVVRDIRLAARLTVAEASVKKSKSRFENGKNSASGRPLTKCKICNQSVRCDRLIKHISKAHPDASE